MTHRAGIIVGLLLLALPIAAAVPLTQDLQVLYNGETDGTTYVNFINAGTYDALNVSTMKNGSGIKGSAMNFTGTNAYVNITSAAALIDELNTGGWSISFWAKTTGINNNEYTFATGASGVNYQSLDHKQTGNGYRFYDGTDWDWDDANNYMTAATWHHVAVTWNDSDNNVRIYYDGKHRQSAATADINNAGTKFLLGIRSDGSGVSDYEGVMDDVAIWNRTLNLADIGIINNSQTYPWNNGITAEDTYGGGAISSFNVSWKNATATLTNSTTTGIAVYDIISGYYDVTVHKFGYYNSTYENVDSNISSNLQISRGTVGGTANRDGFNVTVFNTATLEEYAFNNTNGLTGLVYLAESNATNNTNLTVQFLRENSTGYTTTFLFLQDDHTYTLNFYENTSIINLTFKDLETGSGVNNVSYDFIGSSFYGNFSTTTGKGYHDTIPSGDYTIRYSSVNYSTYYYTLTLLEKTYRELTLYLLDNTANVSITVIDQGSGNNLENAIIEIQRYDLGTGTYLLHERLVTNPEGRANAQLTQYDEYYKILIRYDDELVYTSEPFIIDSNSYTFRVFIEDPVGSNYYNRGGLDYNLTFNNATNNFRLTWSDNSDTLQRIRLTTDKVTFSGSDVYNDTTSISASGTILQGILNGTGDSYKSCAFANFGSGYTLLSCEYADFPDTLPAIGNTFALFMVFIFTGVIIFLALFISPVLMLVLTPLPFLASELGGFTSIGVEYAFGAQLLFIIFALLISKKTT